MELLKGYPQFKQVLRFNRKCGPKFKYIVFLPWTDGFNLLNDLRYRLKKQSYDFLNLIRYCKQYEFRVLYSTLFTKKEVIRYGRIANKTSRSVFTEILNEMYGVDSEFIVVGFKEKGLLAKTMTFEHFRQVVLLS